MREGASAYNCHTTNNFTIKILSNWLINGKEMTNEDPSKQNMNILQDTHQEPDLPEGIGNKQITQSRGAIITAVVVLLLIDILGIVLTFIPGNELETETYSGNYRNIFSFIVDLFLGINILNGKRWAKTILLIRLTIGVIIWGIISIATSDFGTLILNTGVILAIILLLTGNSSRIRISTGIAITIVAIISGIMVALLFPSTDLPSEPEISTIPEYFSNTTSEGFFSISYPPDWSPYMSEIPEAEELMKDFAEEFGIESQVDKEQLVFLGGNIDIDNNLYIGLVISCQPKSLWPIETLVENTNSWLLENCKEYSEHSRIITKIDGRKAIIQTYQYNDATIGLTGFMTGYIAGEQFIWTVVCNCYGEELNSNTDTFNQVIRSLRVEH